MSHELVVDIGAYPHGGDDSIGALLAEYRPDLVLAFDPWPLFKPEIYKREGAIVLAYQAAAWVYDGDVELASHVADSTVMTSKNRRQEWTVNPTVLVPCFDLAKYLALLPIPPVLKLDCEGAEFPLLEALIGTRVPLAEVRVEWHDHAMDDPTLDRRKTWIIDQLECEVRPWEQ